MKNKVVWITGASSGIGEHLAYEFSVQGATVVLSARSEDKLKEVQSQLKYPEKSLIEAMDVADHNAIQSHYHTIKSHVGPIDILINNAGISQRSSVAETLLNVDKRLFDVNFFGNIAVTKAVLPDMMERGTGHIVVISSVAGKMSTGYRSSYSATKHALHGWYDALRAELGDTGVSVNMICPGYIRTEISVNAINGQGGKHGEMDPNQDAGMDPVLCAQKIIKAIEQNRIETYIGGKEIHYLSIRKFFPGLYHSIIRKKAKNKEF